MTCSCSVMADPSPSRADVAWMIEHTSGLDGFFGASSIERLATEIAITEQTRSFKSLRPARKPVALGGSDGSRQADTHQE